MNSKLFFYRIILMMKQFIKNHKKQLSMGCKPRQNKAKQQYLHIQRQEFDPKIFKAQINKMKFIKAKNTHESIKKFKQKSDQTQLAINSALMNLKKNQLLNTGEFLNLQGNRMNQWNDKTLESDRSSTKKTNRLLRKSTSSKSDVKLPILNFKIKNTNQISETKLKPIFQSKQRAKSRRALTFKIT